MVNIEKGIEQLVQDMKRLSEDQETADLCFILGPDDDERVFAHRLIFAAR